MREWEEPRSERGRHAELLRDWRAAAHRTQRAVAEDSGITPGALGQVELGLKVLSEARTIRVGEALGLDVEQLEELLDSRRERAAQLSMGGRGGPTNAGPDIAAEFEKLWAAVHQLRVEVRSLRELVSDDELEAVLNSPPSLGWDPDLQPGDLDRPDDDREADSDGAG